MDDLDIIKKFDDIHRDNITYIYHIDKKKILYSSFL